MIAYIKGIVAAKTAYEAVIEANGIGYELAMSTKALSSLPQTGEIARVWTYMHVKDDGISLFGFEDLAEKEMFTKLINVSGIGPKMAIAALSTYSASNLAALIADGDTTAITRIPGIGKKTAQRVVLELQGILEVETATALPLDATGALTDASLALQSMGFTAEEVSAAFKGVSVEGKDVSALVRIGLKGMGGNR